MDAQQIEVRPLSVFVLSNTFFFIDRLLFFLIFFCIGHLLTFLIRLGFSHGHHSFQLLALRQDVLPVLSSQISTHLTSLDGRLVAQTQAIMSLDTERITDRALLAGYPNGSDERQMRREVGERLGLGPVGVVSLHSAMCQDTPQVNLRSFTHD